MKPYRILYHHRIRAEDGQAVHVREMIHALRAAGHEVMECALVPKADRPESGAGPVSRGGFWRRLSLPRIATECFEVLYSRKGAAMIRHAAAGFRPDFVYERHALHCDAGLRASRALGVPLLLEVNSPHCDEMAELGLLKFASRARRIERAVLGGADRVLAVSQVLAERLVELGAAHDRVRVIRNGADPARVSDAVRQTGRELREDMGLGNGHFVVGFIGYMREWHRLDLVLDAMAAIQADVHLLLLGRGPALEGILSKASQLGLSDRVHALGSVPVERVPEVCTAFDVALVPAINSYASPLKLFESLSAGVATLALDQPNIRELIRDGETGVLFAPGDPAALALRLEDLASDRARTRGIGVAGRAALVENDWTWDGAARRVVKAYEEVA